MKQYRSQSSSSGCSSRSSRGDSRPAPVSAMSWKRGGCGGGKKAKGKGKGQSDQKRNKKSNRKERLERRQRREDREQRLERRERRENRERRLENREQRLENREQLLQKPESCETGTQNQDPRRDPMRQDPDRQLVTPDKPKAPQSGLLVPETRPDFCTHQDSDVIQTRSGYTVEMKGHEVLIFDREGTQLTRIWGDPHVQEADGQTNWHFGEDSTFILPDGTKICLNTEPIGTEWYVVGADIVSGSSRYHWGEGGEAGLTKDGKKWDKANADCSEDASAGVFALQSTGEWAVMGEDGRFYDITEEAWADYLNDKDIDYDPSKVAVGLTSQQVKAAHSDSRKMRKPIPGLEPKAHAQVMRQAADLAPFLERHHEVAEFLSELSPRLLDRYLSRPDSIRKLAGPDVEGLFPGAPAWW